VGAVAGTTKERGDRVDDAARTDAAGAAAALLAVALAALEASVKP